MNEKVNEAMLLKFGQIVDLEKLEVLSSNPVIDEKRHLLREMEQQGSREMAVLDSKIEEKRKELVAMVRDNTLRLNRMHDLNTTMKAMEERLDIRQKSMVSSGSSAFNSHSKFCLYGRAKRWLVVTATCQRRSTRSCRRL